MAKGWAGMGAVARAASKKRSASRSKSSAKSKAKTKARNKAACNKPVQKCHVYKFAGLNRKICVSRAGGILKNECTARRKRKKKAAASSGSALSL